MPYKVLTLTIVIPVYNDKSHLKRCLETIASQTTKPHTVIVVDNASTDGSAQVAKLFPFVTVIQEKKRGVVFARNTGFNACKTDLIGRIDSDTRLPKDWVETVTKFYEDGSTNNAALTGGCYFYNIRWPRFAGWYQSQVAFRFNRLLLGHYILYGSNMVMTRTQWGMVKSVVCKDIHVHEDLDLAIHLHRLGQEITYQESLRVGVVMRRVRSRRNELWDNIMLWPKTLKKHNKHSWVFAWIGALFFYLVSPFPPFVEKISRLLGKEPMPE